ncbi:MAG: hypothetical protein CMJ58_28120 [Planctomycetaceae bacterium]|nr:hypothetical protein [Planctomycetaceae bacterium]
MLEPEDTRFQMVGARAALLSGPVAAAIEQTIDAIENAVEKVPDFAFDLSKTLVETVCKTILADLGQPAGANWDCPKLLKETTNRLSLLPRNFPNAGPARESVEKTVRGMLQTIQGLCELRNNHGIASHGRDGFADRLGARQATLAAQAADTIVAFVYRTHRDALSQSPGDRVYYEDHVDFNETFDRENDPFRLGSIELAASRFLFLADPIAYKTAVVEYVSNRDDPENNGGQEEET